MLLAPSAALALWQCSGSVERCCAELAEPGGFGESVADRCGGHRGVADGRTDVLEPCDPLEEISLPDGHVRGVDLGEADSVARDVADEQRVVVREVGLQFGGPAAPVLGHEVDVQLRDLVQRVQPAVERLQGPVRANAEELEGQVEPEPLAAVVGIRGGRVAVGHAVEALGELLVPGVVDPRRDGDHQVEVVAVEHEVVRVRARLEDVDVVGDELTQLLGGGAEDVNVS